MNARALLARVVEAEQDFEWYPTTDEIIGALVRDIKRHSFHPLSSVLDVGAGNGKVLMALRERAGLKDLHAIEKSELLCEQLHPDVLIVGTEFAEQSLLSKHVDVIFSNPPYSEFEDWAVKIIRQAASELVYLVLPERWEKSVPIADALRFRSTACEKVGQFDFLNAERSARCKVHLLCVALPWERHAKENDDAFERFFNEHFAHLVEKFAETGGEREEKNGSRFGSLVAGAGYLEALVALYDAEMANVQGNFDLMSRLDAKLLREFGISPPSIMESLKKRLAGLRTDYWNELFSRLDTVTNRLTSTSRRRLLDVLQKHVHVDFTESNIRAVLIWVIKNSNIYIDSQLIETYELMVAKCNVQMYKSNQRTWEQDGWRYNSTESKNSHFALDYRIVTHRIGGISKGYSHSDLDERASEFLGDLLTLARNLGFDCETSVHSLGRSGRRDWVSGEKYEFHGSDRVGGDLLRTRAPIVLFDVRAYLNGNLHLRLAKSFIMALNVEHGRLKGWLHSRDEAARELDDPAAAEFFNSNVRLASNPAALLLAGPR